MLEMFLSLQLHTSYMYISKPYGLGWSIGTLHTLTLSHLGNNVHASSIR